MQQKSEWNSNLIYVGKESQYSGKLNPLKIENKITNFPHVNVGFSVVCAFNKWGSDDGMADVYVCRTLEDMQLLEHKYREGIAFSINWYTIQNYYLEELISLSSGKKIYVEKSMPTTSSLTNYQPSIFNLDLNISQNNPSTHQNNISREQHQQTFITSLNKHLKAQKEEEEKLIPTAEMLISNLIKTNDFELSLILNTWSCINFKSNISSEILQEYISELASVGLVFEALKFESYSSVFTPPPSILQIIALPSKIVEKLSVVVQLSSNTLRQ